MSQYTPEWLERQREIQAEQAAWATMTEAERRALVLANIIEFHPRPVEQLIAEGALIPEVVAAHRPRAEEIIEERRTDRGIYVPSPAIVVGPQVPEPTQIPEIPFLAPVAPPVAYGGLHPLPLLMLLLSFF